MQSELYVCYFDVELDLYWFDEVADLAVLIYFIYLG